MPRRVLNGWKTSKRASSWQCASSTSPALARSRGGKRSQEAHDRPPVPARFRFIPPRLLCNLYVCVIFYASARSTPGRVTRSPYAVQLDPVAGEGLRTRWALSIGSRWPESRVSRCAPGIAATSSLLERRRADGIVETGDDQRGSRYRRESGTQVRHECPAWPADCAASPPPSHRPWRVCAPRDRGAWRAPPESAAATGCRSAGRAPSPRRQAGAASRPTLAAARPSAPWRWWPRGSAQPPFRAPGSPSAIATIPPRDRPPSTKRSGSRSRSTSTWASMLVEVR